MIRAWMRALRHRRALRKWCGWSDEWGYHCCDRSCPLTKNAKVAEGYYTARGWLGVESCYLAARRVVDDRRGAA